MLVLFCIFWVYEKVSVCLFVCLFVCFVFFCFFLGGGGCSGECAFVDTRGIISVVFYFVRNFR